MIVKAVSEKVYSVNFVISLRQTVDDIVSPPRYLMKMTEALLDTGELLKPVIQVESGETDRVIEASSNSEKWIKIFAKAAEKTASVCSSPSNESAPMDISDDKTNEIAYKTMDYDKEEHWKRKKESRDYQTKEKIKKIKIYQWNGPSHQAQNHWAGEQLIQAGRWPSHEPLH